MHRMTMSSLARLGLAEQVAVTGSGPTLRGEIQVGGKVVELL